MRPSGPTSTRGSVYVLVVVVVALVSVLGVSALSLATTRTQVTASRGDLDQARLFAISAVELGLANANNALSEANSSGLSLLDLLGGVVGVVIDVTELLLPAQTNTAEGSFAYEYTDRDGNPLEDLSQGVWITGTGRVGSAVWVERAFARIDEGRPLAPLASAVHASDAITIQADSRPTVTGAVMSSDDAIINNGNLTADVSAKALQGTGTQTGTLTTSGGRRGVLSREAFAFYRDRATEITMKEAIEDALIAPAINTHDNALNPEGIYFIRTNGTDLEITHSRIVGTLVIDASAGGRVTISNEVILEPAFDRMPTLIVRGSLSLKSDGSDLHESSTNMNPRQAPYKGLIDSDTSDSYPAEIRGLVHVIGDLEISGEVNVTGSMHVDGTLTCADGQPTINYDPRLLRHIPRHYGEVPNQLRLIIQPDTWTRRPAD